MNMNTMKVLSEEEVQNIVDASSRLLEKIGVKIDSPEVLNKLKKKGLLINMDTGVVKFPAEVQRRCLESVPKEIPVVNRDGEHLYTLGDGSTHFASGHNAVFIDDPVSGVRRQFTVKDVRDYVAVSHHLSDVEMIGLPASPGDVPVQSSLLYSLQEAFANSDKPVYFSTDSAKINHYAIDMTYAAAPDAMEKGAYMISQLSPTSPLFWEKGAIEGVVECAERNFPVSILPEPISGITAPYSLAGLVTVHNVEALSGIFITQIINPGTPVIWASSWTTFDMKKSAALVGSVETTLCRIAGAQVAKYYNLPLHTTAPNSDNHALDEQNSWEKTFSAFSAAAAGNDLVLNMGMYACGLTISLDQLVMDAEIVGQVRRLKHGVDASVDMIAENLISMVGHKGSFITEEHTLNLLYSNEHREPLITVRGSIDIWEKKGKKDAAELARDIVVKLLRKALPTICDEQYKAMSAVIHECENREE